MVGTKIPEGTVTQVGPFPRRFNVDIEFQPVILIYFIHVLFISDA